MGRKALITALLVVVAGGAALSYFYFQDESKGTRKIENFQQATKSPQNIIAEEYLPDTLSLLAALNLNDETMINNMEHLISLFPDSEELKDGFWEGLLEEMNEDLIEYDIDFETDVRPIFTPPPRIVVGMDTESSKETEPTIYLAISMSDLDAFNNLKAKLFQAQTWNKEMEDDLEIITGSVEDDFYAFLQEDVLFISNKKENLVAIAKGEYKDSSLLRNKAYQDIVSQLETPHLGLFYINPDVFIQQMMAFAETESPGSSDIEEMKKLFDSDVYKIMEGLGLSLIAEKDGLELQGYLVGNEELMKEINYTFSFVPNKALYLIDKIPASNTILYEEIYNPLDAFKKSMELQPEEIAFQLQAAWGFIQAMAIGQTGLNLQEDVFALMDQGIAFAIQHETANLMPQITLLIDVKGKQSRTENLINAIDKGIDWLVQEAEKETGSSSFITRSSVDIKGKDLNHVQVNLEEVITNVPDLPPAAKDMVENMKMELTYGVTGDGVFVLSTIADFDETYATSSIANEDNFKEASMHAEKKTQGLIYFDIEHTLGYVDEIVNYVEQVEPFSTADQESYEKIMNVLKPFKYLIGSSYSNEYDSSSSGFIKITE